MAVDAIEAAIQSSIEGLSDDVVDDGVDTSVDDGDDSTEEETVVEEDKSKTTDADTTVKSEAKTDKTVEKKVDEVVEDALAKELNLKPRQDGKENRIPYSRVKEITSNRENKVIEIAAKALGFDAKGVKFDQLESVVAEKVKALQIDAKDLNNMRIAEEVLTTDGDEYIRILARIDPEKYQKFADIVDGKVTTTKTGKTTEVVDEDEEIMNLLPEPDLPYGDKGDKTYSVKGLRTALATVIKEARKQGAAEANKALKPVNDREAANKKQADFDRAFEATMAEAMTWDGFEESADEILKLLQNDKKGEIKTLHQAYIKIVPKKLREAKNINEQELRKKIMDEMKKAPGSTSVSADSASKTTAEGGDEDRYEAAIRRSIAKLKR